MRAVVHDRYGPPDVLRLAEVEKPVPKEDEILIRIHATTVNRSDCGWRAPQPFFSRVFTGLLRPKRPILGSELAGVVEAVGAAVTGFEAGDEVFGTQVGRPRRVRLRAGERGGGAQAGGDELRGGGGGLRRRDHRLDLPAEGRSTAGPEHRRLRRLRIDRHRRRAAGQGTSAPRSTAVCNTKNVELVRSLGADEVVDYTAVDFTRNGEDVRRRLRRGRQALVQAVPAVGEAGRRLHRDRPRLSLACPAARAADPVDRGQAGDDSDPEVHAGGGRLPQGADRGRASTGP